MSGVSINSLRMFLAVVEYGSVSRAGRELGVSQPAVSGHLHSLEERYGVVLVDRGRPIKPTPAGKAFSLHARRILAAYGEMEEEMSRQVEPRGVLEVGASTTPAEVVIPGMVTEFAGRYPEVDLRVRVGDTEEVLGALTAREVEVAVVGLQPDAEGLESRTLEEDGLAVIAASSSGISELSLDGLASRPFVLREKGSATRREVERVFAGSGFVLKSAMDLGSHAAIVGAVAAGAGVGVVPERVVSGDPRVKIIEVEGLSMSRPLVLVNERDRQLSPAALAFRELCIEGLAGQG